MVLSQSLEVPQISQRYVPHSENPANRNAGKGKPSEVATLLVAEGKLNSGFINPIPPGNLSGRTVEQGKSNSKYGYTPIGNSIENKGKKFRK